MLRQDKNLQERYTVEVRQGYSLLLKEEDSQTEKYGKFVTATKEAAKECIPTIPKTKKPYLSDSNEVKDARDALEKASKEYEQKRSKSNRLSLKACKQALNDTYAELEEKKIEETIQEINQAHASQKHAKAWKCINDLTEGKVPPQAK